MYFLYCLIFQSKKIKKKQDKQTDKKIYKPKLNKFNLTQKKLKPFFLQHFFYHFSEVYNFPIVSLQYNHHSPQLEQH